MEHENTLQLHRRAAGLSQQDVADLVYVHRNTILDYESGKRTPPLNTARRISAVLGVPVAVLWPSTDDAA